MSELLGKEVVKAMVLGGGISETQAGKPQAFVLLEDEKGRTWTWNGSFNEGKAREITLKALQAAGFAGGLNDLAVGKGFTKGHEASITIDDEFNEDRTKNWRKVQWINTPSKASTLMNEVDAILKLQSMGVDADFAAMFGGGNSAAQTGKDIKSEDVPF